MSVIRVTYIACDGCGENNHGDAIDVGETAAEMRSRFRREFGWVSKPGGLDFCHDCRTEKPS